MSGKKQSNSLIPNLPHVHSGSEKPLYFLATNSDAREAKRLAQKRYPFTNDAEKSYGVVGMGGDHAALLSFAIAMQIKKKTGIEKPVFTIHYGTKGWMMNPNYVIQDIYGYLAESVAIPLVPLQGRITLRDGQVKTRYGFNDISLKAATVDKDDDEMGAIRYHVYINGMRETHDPIIGDGVVCSTIMGSTGYYNAAGASDFRWCSNAIGIKAIASKPDIYSLISSDSVVTFSSADTSTKKKKQTSGKCRCPAVVGYDGQGIRNVKSVRICAKPEYAVNLHVIRAKAEQLHIGGM